VAFTYIGFGLFIVSISAMGLLAASTKEFPTLFNESQFLKRMGQRALVAVVVAVPLFILTDTPTVSPDVSAFLWMTLTVFLSINPILLIVRPKLCIVWRQDTVVLGSHLRQGIGASATQVRSKPTKKETRAGTKTTPSTKKPYTAADTCNLQQKKIDSTTGIRPLSGPLPSAEEEARTRIPASETSLPAGELSRVHTPMSTSMPRRKSEVSSRQHSKTSLNLSDQISRSSERSFGLDHLGIDDLAPKSFNSQHLSVSFRGQDDDAAVVEPPSPATRAETLSSIDTDSSIPIRFRQKSPARLIEAESKKVKASAYPKFMDFVPGATQPPNRRIAAATDSPMYAKASPTGATNIHGRRIVTFPDSPTSIESPVGPTNSASRRVTAVSDYPKFTEFRPSSREGNKGSVPEPPKLSQRRFSSEEYLDNFESPNARNKKRRPSLIRVDDGNSTKMNDTSVGDFSVASNTRLQESSAMLGSAPSPGGGHCKKPIIIYSDKPLPSRLIREMIRVKPILEGVLQSTMAGIQAPREELESLRMAGTRLGHVCDRLEFAEEEEETDDEKEDHHDAGGSSAPQSITGLRLIRGKTLGWFAGGGGNIRYQ
jgi:hypothetical protein